jgi:hypothetical protein
MTAVRCSIAILFLRTFFTRMFPRLRFAGTYQTSRRRYHYVLSSLTEFVAYWSIGTAIVWFVVMVVVPLFQCRPIEYLWTPPLGNQNHCIAIKPFTAWMVFWCALLDIEIWLLPHFVVWKLQLRLAHKIAISVIFALGLLCGDVSLQVLLSFANISVSNVIVGCMRLVTILHMSIGGDLTYELMPPMIWALARISSAIIVACFPLLRPIFEKMLPLKLTRVMTTARRPSRPRLIHVTTKIHLDPASSRPRSDFRFHDGLLDIEGPTFEVDRPQRKKLLSSMC